MRQKVIISAVLTTILGVFLVIFSHYAERSVDIDLSVEKGNKQEVASTENDQLTQDKVKKEDTSSTHDGILNRTYPITDGKTYRIMSIGKQYGCENETYIAANTQEILEVNIDGDWREVYRTKEKSIDDAFCADVFGISQDFIKLSPLKDYVEFGIGAWERGEFFLINTKTKKMIVGSNDSEVNMHGLVWSENAKNYAFLSVYNAMGGDGRNAIYVSRYNNPDKPVSIFDLQNWANGDKDAPLKYELKTPKFLDDKSVEFSVFSQDVPFDNDPPIKELARYHYDLQKEKLTEVFRKK